MALARLAQLAASIMPTLRPIELAATPNNWRLFMLRRSDPAFLSFQQKIHQRDLNTCQFCGFQSRDNLETINHNGNYLDNKKDNLLSACGLCAQCFFLEGVGKSDFGGGVLIYLPELAQNELNALCHEIFSAMVYRLPWSTSAKNIYRSLKMRAQLIEEKVGEGLSNPSHFGQLLIDADAGKASVVQSTVASVFRLLPNMARFSTEIIGWTKEGLRCFEV